MTSTMIHNIHWVLYIGSFLAILSLFFTRYRKWGAICLGILFLTQGMFQECLMVFLENYLRAQEGHALLPSSMLVDRFTRDIAMQQLLSYALAIASFMLAGLSWSIKQQR